MLAIVITIMVLELRAPHEATLEALVPLWPKFLSYILSFAFLAIYWSNHHHLLQAARAVTGRVLWANVHLLFWLSLVPFVTAWMGENDFGSIPVAVYGVAMIMPAVAYTILTRALIAVPDQSAALAAVVGNDLKGKVSILAYVAAVPIALFVPFVAVLIYVLVAALWFVPDQRMERAVKSGPR